MRRNLVRRWRLSRGLCARSHVTRGVANWNPLGYSLGMAIKTFAHKGLERFYKTGSKSGIQAVHAAKLARILARLNSAAVPSDMNIAGWNLHPLTGDLKNHWSVKVNGNWRITFRLENGHAEIVDYQDYH